MKTLLRAVLAVVAGMALALVLVIGVEMFSSVVHPVPEGFTGTMDEMCQHVARYPDWVLGVAVAGLDRNSIHQYMGCHSNWKSPGRPGSDPHLDGCDRI